MSHRLASETIRNAFQALTCSHISGTTVMRARPFPANQRQIKGVPRPAGVSKMIFLSAADDARSAGC